MDEVGLGGLVRPIPRRPLRRPAAAHRDRTRSRRRPQPDPRRRAHRRAGLRDRRGGAGAAEGRCDAGAAALLVTHEARHAGWADRVVFLRDGAVVDEAGCKSNPDTSCWAGNESPGALRFGWPAATCAGTRRGPC